MVQGPRTGTMMDEQAGSPVFCPYIVRVHILGMDVDAHVAEAVREDPEPCVGYKGGMWVDIAYLQPLDDSGKPFGPTLDYSEVEWSMRANIEAQVLNAMYERAGMEAGL